MAAQHAVHARLLAASESDATGAAPPDGRDRSSSNSHAALNDVYASRSAAVAHFVSELTSLAQGKSYQERQLFVRLAEVMWVGDRSFAPLGTRSVATGVVDSAPVPPVISPALFTSPVAAGALVDAAALRTHILPWIVTLACDKVPNVRLAVARTIQAAITSQRMVFLRLRLPACLSLL